MGASIIVSTFGSVGVSPYSDDDDAARHPEADALFASLERAIAAEPLYDVVTDAGSGSTKWNRFPGVRQSTRPECNVA